MARIVDYQKVLEELTGQGLKCNYPNGGAFGFESGALVRGWIGPVDSTIRASMLAEARQVAKPFEENLAGLLTRVWEKHLPGVAWVMPGSHWSYELHHGNGKWLAELIGDMGLDDKILAARTDAAAIEFSADEREIFQRFAQTLLEKLVGSDFFIAFLGRPAVCTLHHHRQIWWMTTDNKLIEHLDKLCG
jgi:hypothetical protein